MITTQTPAEKLAKMNKRNWIELASYLIITSPFFWLCLILVTLYGAFQ